MDLPKLGEHVKLDRERDPIEGEVVRHFGDAVVIEDRHGTRVMVTDEQWCTEGGIILPPAKVLHLPQGYL